jgi:hypothetical protein
MAQTPEAESGGAQVTAASARRAQKWWRLAFLCLGAPYCFAMGFTPTTIAATALGSFSRELSNNRNEVWGAGSGFVLIPCTPALSSAETSALTSGPSDPVTFTPFAKPFLASSEPTQSSIEKTGESASRICSAKTSPSTSRAYDSIRIRRPRNDASANVIALALSDDNRRGSIRSSILPRARRSAAAFWFASATSAVSRPVSFSDAAWTRAVTRDAINEDAKEANSAQAPKISAKKSAKSAMAPQEPVVVPHIGIGEPPIWLAWIGIGLVVLGIAGHCWLAVTRHTGRYPR